MIMDMAKQMILVAAALVALSANASAGFMDNFNKLNQAVQQTTSTVENARNTANRAYPEIKQAKGPACASGETRRGQTRRHHDGQGQGRD
jgi:hypothetical protein